MSAIFFILAPILGILAYFKVNKQFGGKLTKELIDRYSKSPNWKKKGFDNARPAKMEMGPKHLPKLIREQFFNSSQQSPTTPLEVVPFDAESFNESSNQAKFIWYGHAAFLIHMAGKVISIDPMMGPDASPIGPFRTKRFSENTIGIIDQWPELDAVLFTHDHYDHIDYKSIQKLRGKVKHWYVALGVARHLERWGIPKDNITEMDWWDTTSLGDIKLTFTPTQHFSGRGPTDRGKSFWGGWVLKSSTENIYFTGDGGYAPHFVEVGEKLGPFDLCITECGQYNSLWHAIHMYPEEAVQAALDVHAKKAIPFHWAGFRLSPHPWKEPIERFITSAEKAKLDIATPKIGQLFTVQDANFNPWWENYK